MISYDVVFSFINAILSYDDAILQYNLTMRYFDTILWSKLYLLSFCQSPLQAKAGLTYLLPCLLPE